MKLKKLLTICLSLSFVSCQIQPIDLEQCSAIINFTEENGKRILDEENSYCLCRNYRHSSEFIGSISETEEKDISHCSKIIGYNPEDYILLNDFKENIRQRCLLR